MGLVQQLAPVLLLICLFANHVRRAQSQSLLGAVAQVRSAIEQSQPPLQGNCSTAQVNGGVALDLRWWNSAIENIQGLTVAHAMSQPCMLLCRALQQQRQQQQRWQWVPCRQQLPQQMLQVTTLLLAQLKWQGRTPSL
jgi:hypothetical protein